MASWASVRTSAPSAWDLAAAIGGRVPEALVTFEPLEEASGAWQEVKGEAVSVNVAISNL